MNIDDLSPVERRAILRELLKREQSTTKHEDKYRPTRREIDQAKALYDAMFPQQRAFFTDPHPRRVGFCTRRAGKTTGAGLDFLATLLLNPGSLCLYIAQTASVARMYLWRELKKLVARYQLPFTFNETNLWMIHSRGGGMLILKGADKADEIEKLRGPKWKKVILDESASFGAHIEALIVEVIGPALRDEGGHLILLGTPGRHPSGLFYEASEGVGNQKHWKVYRWSLKDNPFLPDEAKDYDIICQDEGLTREDPRFRREYLGIWTLNEAELMFRYDPERNSYDLLSLPTDHRWTYVFGCDFGWEDETAISVLAYSLTSKTIYICETWAKNHQLADDVARRIFELKLKYPTARLIGDTGGYGKGVAMEIQRDYGLFIEQAKKMEKLNHVEFMNSAFLRGDLLVKKGDKLGDEYLKLPWNADRTDAHSHARDNRAMATLYGWRAASYYAGKKKRPEQLSNDLNQIAMREKLSVLGNKNDQVDATPWYLRGGSADSYGPDSNSSSRF